MIDLLTLYKISKIPRHDAAEYANIVGPTIDRAMNHIIIMENAAGASIACWYFILFHMIDMYYYWQQSDIVVELVPQNALRWFSDLTTQNKWLCILGVICWIGAYLSTYKTILLRDEYYGSAGAVVSRAYMTFIPIIYHLIRWPIFFYTLSKLTTSYEYETEYVLITFWLDYMIYLIAFDIRNHLENLTMFPFSAASRVWNKQQRKTLCSRFIGWFIDESKKNNMRDYPGVIYLFSIVYGLFIGVTISENMKDYIDCCLERKVDSLSHNEGIMKTRPGKGLSMIALLVISLAIITIYNNYVCAVMEMRWYRMGSRLMIVAELTATSIFANIIILNTSIHSVTVCAVLYVVLIAALRSRGRV